MPYSRRILPVHRDRNLFQGDNTYPMLTTHHRYIINSSNDGEPRSLICLCDVPLTPVPAARLSCRGIRSSMTSCRPSTSYFARCINSSNRQSESYNGPLSIGAGRKGQLASSRGALWGRGGRSGEMEDGGGRPGNRAPAIAPVSNDSSLLSRLRNASPSARDTAIDGFRVRNAEYHTANN